MILEHSCSYLNQLFNFLTLSSKILAELLTSSGVALGKCEYTICDLLSKELLVVPDMRKVSNLPPPGTCPFPKGNYTIKNYKINEEKFRFVPPGEFVTRVRIFEDGQVIGEYSVEATVKM